MRGSPFDRQPLSVAVIGAGRFGRAHLERYAQRPDCRVVGVIGSSPDDMRALAASVGAPDAAVTLDELDDRDLDAASIASPSALHVSQASRLLARDVPVLVEKPVALSAADGHALLDAERRSAAFVMPGHILRFSAPYRSLRDRLRRGEVGRPLAISFTKHRTRDHDDRYPDEHPVTLTGVHDVDLALWLVGADVVDVRSSEVRVDGRAQPTAVFTDLTTAEGVHLHLTNTWSLRPGDHVPDRVEIVGEQGLLRLQLSPRVESGGADVDDEIAPAGGGGALSEEIDHFLGCVRRGEPSDVISLREAVAGLELVERIVQAGSGR